MKVAVFAASGRTGRHMTKIALKRGHRVVAFVRDKNKLDIEHKNLEVCVGNMFNLEDVEKAVKGQDAILSAIGASKLKETDTILRGTKSIVIAMKKHDVKRIVAMSSMGVGDSWQYQPLFSRAMLKLVLHRQFKDHGRQEEMLKSSGLDWTAVRAGILDEAPQKGACEVGFSLKAKRVPREQIAAFAVLEMEDGNYICQTPSVT